MGFGKIGRIFRSETQRRVIIIDLPEKLLPLMLEHAEIALADDKALSHKNSPFRTIGSLVSYANGEIEAARGQ